MLTDNNTNRVYQAHLMKIDVMLYKIRLVGGDNVYKKIMANSKRKAERGDTFDMLGYLERFYEFILRG